MTADNRASGSPSESAGQNVGAPAPPTRAGRIEAIDGFRALAMLMVLLYHSWEFSGSPTLELHLGSWHPDLFGLLRGNTRVDLFVVLSGFCLFLPLSRKPEALGNWDWKSYARRRLRRIVPTYYAALAYAVLLPVILVALLKALHREASWQAWPSAGQWVSHLLFLHNFSTKTWNGINGSLWTMSLEMQFYVAFPLLVIGLRRFGIRFLGFIIALSVLYRMIAGTLVAGQPKDVRFLFEVFFVGRWMQFVLGMLACWLVMRYRARNHWLGARQSSLALLLAGSFYLLAVGDLGQEPPGHFPLREVALGLAFALAIGVVCTSHTPLRFLLENKLVTSIGFISYSLFLIHQPTVYYLSQFLSKVLHIGDGVLLFCVLAPLGFAIVLPLGYAFFLLFERPVLLPEGRKKEKFDLRRKSAAPEPLFLWKID